MNYLIDFKFSEAERLANPSLSADWQTEGTWLHYGEAINWCLEHIAKIDRKWRLTGLHNDVIVFTNYSHQKE